MIPPSTRRSTAATARSAATEKHLAVVAPGFDRLGEPPVFAVSTRYAPLNHRPVLARQRPALRGVCAGVGRQLGQCRMEAVHFVGGVAAGGLRARPARSAAAPGTPPPPLPGVAAGAGSGSASRNAFTPHSMRPETCSSVRSKSSARSSIATRTEASSWYTVASGSAPPGPGRRASRSGCRGLAPRWPASRGPRGCAARLPRRTNSTARHRPPRPACPRRCAAPRP